MKKITFLFYLMSLIGFVTTAQSPCDYTVVLNDSFGDGWNGATLDVLVDGAVVLDDITLADGASGSVPLPNVSDGQEITTVLVSPGDFPGEISYEIQDNLGSVVGSGDASTDITTPIVVACQQAPPTPAAILTLAGCDNSDSYSAAFDAAVDGVVWVQLDYDGTCFAATVDTEGSDFDTEIGLYDAVGNRIGNDDDGGTGTLSSFTEAGLPAGTYYIAAGGFNTTFGTNSFDVTTTSGETGNLVVNASTPVVPSPPAAVATLNVSGCDTIDTYAAAFDASVDGVVWVELVYDGGCTELTVDTEGSDFDTEIGLYDSNGLLIGNNDDGGTGTLSSFTEAGLAAGTYYIASGGFNITFGGTDFDVTTTSGATGNLTVNASTPIPPPPATVGTLTLAGCGDLDTYSAAFDASVDGVVWLQLDYDGTCFAATIDTEGSDFDTEIGLYDVAGNRIGNDDDGGTGTLSSFTEGGLAAGTYYVATGGFNTVFGDTIFDVTTTSGETGNLVVNASTPTAPAPPATVATLNVAGCEAIDTYSAAFDASVDGVVWVELIYDGGCFELTVDTEGSDFDTEIGLYDSNGLLIGNNDDGGTGSLSLFTADDLAAGTYYIASGGFNVVYGGTDFDVTTTSSATGNLVVNASTPSSCQADAGTLIADATPVQLNGTTTISATEDTAPVVPAGFTTLYVLTSGAGLVIEQTNATPSFDVTVAGDYTIHTLVYDPNTLDPGSLPSGATGFDVNALLIQGGGTICGALDVAGAQITVSECIADAGTLTADASTVALDGTTTISATEDTAPIVPAGFTTLYVLTSGAGLLIEQTNATPSFDVTVVGDYTIHTLVYDPNTLDPGSLPSGATGFDVNALLIQGGGTICGALDVTGAPVSVVDPASLPELLIVDLSTPNEVTVIAGSGLSLATESGSNFTGFLLANFFANAGTQAITNNFVSGDLTSANEGSDGSPNIFRGGAGTDAGLNIWSYADVGTSTFTAGQIAFAGQATWTLTVDEYNAFLTAPDSGLIYFPADSSDDIAGGAALIGGYTVTTTPLSIDDAVTNEFSYYPNPVRDILNISSQKVIGQIAMFNMLGQQVMNVRPNALTSELDMSSLQSGAYLVRVVIGDSTETIRVVKQ